MVAVRLALRRLVRHWRMNMILFAGLSFGAGLLALLPSFADTTANAALVQSLENASGPASNLLVTGSRRVMTGRLSGYIEEQAGELITERLEVRTGKLGVRPEREKQLFPVDAEPRQYFHYILPWSFDRQSELLEIVAGKWPVVGGEPPPPKPFDPPTFQAAMEASLAEQTGFKLGDVLVEFGGTKFKLVGFFRQRDPQDPIWWEDPRPFQLVTDPGINEDEYSLSLLLSRGDMDTIQSNQVDWRFLVNHAQLTPDTAAAISQKMIAIKSRVDASGAAMASNLPELLHQYLEDLDRVRTVIFLLAIQSFAFVLYSLAVLSAHANRLSESEIVTLAGRGASQGLIGATFSIDRLLLALVAGGVTGPLLAWGFLNTWSRLSGEAVPAGLPQESWLLSAVGAVLGWLALVLPVASAARHSLLEFQRQRARPEPRTAWQKRYVDVFLLVLGGLAYWQLSSSRGFYFQQLQQSSRTDPLLLIGPTLLLIALALMFLRLFPYLLGFFAWIAGVTRGLVLKLGLARLARDPVQASQILLLISMAVGLAVFSAGFRDSLRNAQQQAARFQAGADLRVLQGSSSVEVIGSLPGVEAAALVFRDQVEREDQNRVTMLAVDATSMAQVARYPEGMSNVSMMQIMRALRPPDRVGPEGSLLPSDAAAPENDFGPNPYIQEPVNPVPIPAVFSFAALPSNTGIGDTVRVTYRGEAITLEVRGILADFPTVTNRYLLVDHGLLGEYIDLDSPRDVRNREIWLTAAAQDAPALAASFREQGLLLGAANERLAVLTTNAMAWGTQRAFTLNAVVLVALSISGFLLISYFNARQRAYEFGVLRASGLASHQLVGMLAGEGIIVLVLGFISGTAVGLGLLALMRFYLSQVLRQVLPGLEVRALALDAQSLLAVYGVLVLFFAAATVFLLVSLLRTGIQRTLRLGEE